MMKTLLAIDFDRHAAATYRANFPDVEVRCADVADQVQTLPYADVVLAGFPCQPHSLAGKRLASDDERDGGDTFVSAVRRVQPRMFLGENVPGLLTSEDGHYVVRLVQNLEAAGYLVEYRVLDAVDYGVPQFRARVFFWGIRNDVYDSGVRWQWPKRTHVDPATRGGMFGDDLPAWVTVGQALGIEYWGTETQTSGGMAKVPRKADVPSCAPVASGNALGGLLAFEGIRRERGSGVERRDHGVDEPCPTVMAPTGGAEPVTHAKREKYVRRLTPLECARLQSVPDSFRWPEGITKTAQYRIVGNGMACAMMAALAEAFQRADPKSKTMIDLFCGGGLGATGWHGMFWKMHN